MRRIAYHGGGYVGLTGAVHYAKVGLDVVIFDPDQEVTTAINLGVPKADHFVEYLGNAFIDAITDKKLRATSIPENILDVDAHIIAIPSERNGSPWMDIVIEHFAWLNAACPSHVPIIIESTLMPGMAATLRESAELRSVHRPWAIAPRRDWFADPEKNLATLTRVVGRDAKHHAAIDPWITAVCRDVQWTTPETAEITKALENALLHLPVMLLHELALLYPDYDMVEAAALASSHWRFKSMGKLYLGLGTGGRCVPLGSRYLADRGGALLGDAIELDEQFANEAIARILAGVDYKEVLILGVAYRPGFGDTGNSPGMRAAAAFGSKLCVCIVDPHVASSAILDLITQYDLKCGMVTDLDDKFKIGTFDVVVLTVAHPEFTELWRGLKPGTVVIDATGMWEGRRDDIRYTRPGRADWVPTDDEIQHRILSGLNIQEKI